TPAVTAGSHLFTWNLRYPGYTDFEGRIFWAAGNSGPSAVPGRYQVRLTVGDVVQTQEFEITIDPRIADQVTVAQLQERFDFALRIRDRVSDANEAVSWIRNIKAAIDERLEKTTDRAVTRQATAVKERLSAVEGEIYQVRNQSNQDPLNFPIKLNNKLAALMGVVESGEASPTDQSRKVYAHLDSLLQRQLDQLNAAVQTDLTRLNDLLRGQNLEPVEVERPKREEQ
ncbi:MAG: glycosyl hydrolase, partial [Gemmatimonadota bacterium]|nr:glycosyl hydrolase [Gemmatimonadota bacterium]